ncbi:MAG: hypothetical protein IJF39_02285 [Clostridia bacterium]|nr:hypothetical protein [Clostridia bacterium]
MRWNKIILKAFLQTLAAALLLMGISLGVVCLAFPQTMMDITYSMGMDEASVNFALTSYERFETVDYILHGADTALEAKLYAKAEECLEKLIADDDFEATCEALDAANEAAGKPTGYRAYYYRQICLAKYEVGKGTESVDCAVSLLGGKFEEGNPLVAVVAAARADGQAGQPTLVYALEQMRKLQIDGVCDGYDEAQRAYFGQVLDTLQKWTA